MRIKFIAPLICLMVMFIYGPSVRYEFVTHDDHEYVFENERVLSGLTTSNIVWAATSCGYASNWHPLCWWSLQGDASLVNFLRKNSSMKALALVMHGHNVLLHAINAVLLFFLLIIMGRKIGVDYDEANSLYLCAAFALLWAIHPLRSEVVCWVSERKELVSAFWMLLSMMLWISRRKEIGFSYCCSLICFILALLAKPVAVTLPVALFAWEWMIARKSLRKCALLTVVFGVLSLGVSALTLLAQTDAMETGLEIDLKQRIAMTLYAPVVYLRQTLLPYGLSAFYPLPKTFPLVETALGVILLISLVSIVIYWIVRRNWWNSLCAFGIGWAYVALIPMLGIVKVGSQPYSDRYTYWSGCAVIAVACLLCQKLNEQWKGKLINLAIVFILVLAALTWQRNAVWRTSMALYCDAVPKSWDTQAVCSLASQFMKRGEVGAAQAEAMLREAVMQNKAVDVRAEFARVVAFRAEKSPSILNPEDEDPTFVEPRMDAELVLEQCPTHPRAHEAMAFILLKEGRPSEALRHLEEAQKTERKSEQAWLSKFIKRCRQQIIEEKNVQR